MKAPRFTLALSTCIGVGRDRCGRSYAVRLWPWSGEWITRSHGLCRRCYRRHLDHLAARERGNLAALEEIARKRRARRGTGVLALAARALHSVGLRGSAHRLFAASRRRIHCPVRGCRQLLQYAEIPPRDRAGKPRRITRIAGPLEALIDPVASASRQAGEGRPPHPAGKRPRRVSVGVGG